jgi:hypothetical protein
MVFHGIETGGELKPSRDVRVTGSEFVGFKDLGKVDLLPPLGGFLKRAYRSGYRGGAVYLGRIWKDVE